MASRLNEIYVEENAENGGAGGATIEERITNIETMVTQLIGSLIGTADETENTETEDTETEETEDTEDTEKEKESED